MQVAPSTGVKTSARLVILPWLSSLAFVIKANIPALCANYFTEIEASRAGPDSSCLGARKTYENYVVLLVVPSSWFF